MPDYTVNLDSSVYYAAGYWNDLTQVSAYLARRVSGSPTVSWHQHLLRSTGKTQFRKALVLNCGNGWVERDLLEAGVVAEAVGIDISTDLLEQARKEATVGGLPLRYYERDINTADLPEDGYDLVVNYAAAHHIAYLDKVFRRICELLPEDGVFASSDYVGAHRNQYGYAEWDALTAVNRTLPEAYRQTLSYPHLPTMLVGDPTEAIHSELILETTRRYFDVAELKPMGGALAYLLLTFNRGIHEGTGPERDAVVEQIIAADDAYTDTHPQSTLFAFFWGRPNKSVLADPAQLARWSAEETARESAATAAGGIYYPLSALQELTQELSLQRTYNQHLRSELDQVGRVESDPGHHSPARRALVSTLERRAPGLTKSLVALKHRFQHRFGHRLERR